MFEIGVTSELWNLLVSQGEIKPAAGTVGLGNKMPGERSHTAAHPGVVTDAGGGVPAPIYELREERSPIRLIVNNTAVRKSAMNRTPFLTIVRN